jgi:hypothetical protein
MRFPPLLLLASCAAAPEPTAPMTPIPVAPAVMDTAPASAQTVTELDASAPAPAPAENELLDLARAPRVHLKDAPSIAKAPKPVGNKPAKARLLKQTSKVPDNAALARTNAKTPPRWDPSRPSELRSSMTHHLPEGARADIPLSFEGKPLGVLSESGGKLLLLYGGRWLAVVDGKNVEQILDFDPPDLPLTEDERSFADVEQAVFRDGVVYACRGYNAWQKTRKGIVTAVDAATGMMRWRSDVKVCGGVLTLLGEWVVTGYGAIDTPYAIKLLRAHDGVTVQSLPLFGAAIELYPSGDTVVAITYKDRVTYALSP